ncbi:MAG: terminase large subunit [Clostridia bacterium]|nr:terminase large subunit [Clostridia bacterium]MBP3905702.1 terminase large subunit [Peptostreptococcaceae bacterium]MBP3928119.1 terminase large subunit [Peptostreptococcaceae bacterium]
MDNYKYKQLKSYDYATKVVNGEIISGKYIILACQKFLSDLERMEEEDFEWEFKYEIAEVITDFQQLFKFADGMLQGKPMVLDPFQEFILHNLFAWKHKEKGYNRYSKAYIQVARKNGKSMLLGYIGLFKALFTVYAQVFVVATKKEQAAIVMREIKKMLDGATYVKDKFKVYSGLHMKCSVTDAQLGPLSSDANTLDGLGIDLGVVDEYGAHPNADLYNVILSSQMYKPDAQICIITTAYPNTLTSPAYSERCMVMDMLDGKIPMNERYFGMIYELDEEDIEDDGPNGWRNPEKWIKANPLLANFPIVLDKMKNDYQDGLSNPEKMRGFMTKNLNIWLVGEGAKSYLDYKVWQECQVDKIDFSGREVIVGIDMSKTTDLTGVTIIAKNDQGKVIMKSKAFIPSENIIQKETMDKLPYSSYIATGKDWLEATPGKYVNQLTVENYVRSIEQTHRCKIKAIAFDSWNALHLMSNLAEDYDVIDVKMSYKYFSPVIKRFREIVYDRGIEHEYNPILNFCVGNAVTKEDTQENILLDKTKSTNRIDLLVSSIIGFSEIIEEEVEDCEGDYFMI